MLQGDVFPRVALVMLCVLLHAMDVFVIATVLPTIVNDIGGVSLYAWLTAIYVVCSIMGAASGAMLSGNIGLRRALLTAASAYLLGSLICAAAPAMVIFLGGRVAQGLGGGLLVSLAYTMIRQLFDDSIRSRVFATLSVVWGTAALVGPFFGGVFAQVDFWRGVYLLTLPIFVMMVFLILRALQDQPAGRGGGKLPWRRLLLLGGSVLCIIFTSNTDTSALRIILLATAICGIVLMFWQDHRSNSRLFPSRPTSLRKPVGIGYWLFFLFALTYTPYAIFMPLLAQQLHEVPPSLAGYVNAAMALGWSSASIITAGASVRMQRLLMITGPVCILIGVIGQSLVIASGPLYLLAGLVLLVGLGIGQCFAHFSNQILSNAKAGEESVTAGAIPTMQSLGIAVGAASGGLLANMAGLSQGISPSTLITVTEWVYGFCLVPATLSVFLGIHMVWRLRVIDTV